MEGVLRGERWTGKKTHLHFVLVNEAAGFWCQRIHSYLLVRVLDSKWIEKHIFLYYCLFPLCNMGTVWTAISSGFKMIFFFFKPSTSIVPVFGSR